MGSQMNRDLADISKYLFGAEIDTQLGVTGYNGSLLAKTVSTPLVRSAVIAILLATVVAVVFIFAPTEFWANVLGCLFLAIILLTAAFVLIVPLVKPCVAESDIQAMFFVYVGLVRQSLELPTQIDGESIIDANQEQLTQPVQKTTTITAKANITREK